MATYLLPNFTVVDIPSGGTIPDGAKPLTISDTAPSNPTPNTVWLQTGI